MAVSTAASFSGNVIIDVHGKDDIANNVILQPDNKILLGGYTTGTDNLDAFCSLRLKTVEHWIILLVLMVFKQLVYSQGDIAYAMSLLPNGKILLAGQTNAEQVKYIKHCTL